MLKVDALFTKALKESLMYCDEEGCKKVVEEVEESKPEYNATMMVVRSTEWHSDLEEELGDSVAIISLDRRIQNVGEWDTSDIEMYIDEITDGEDTTITLELIKKFLDEKCSKYVPYSISLYEHSLYAVSLSEFDEAEIRYQLKKLRKGRNSADTLSWDTTPVAGIMLIEKGIKKEHVKIFGEILEDYMNGQGMYTIDYVKVNKDDPEEQGPEIEEGYSTYIEQDYRYDAEKLAKEYSEEDVDFVDLDGNITEIK